MRTERLFWADPYVTRSEAYVVAVEGNCVFRSSVTSDSGIVTR